MCPVDDHRRRAVDIEGHVADDTDDFVFAAGAEPLTEDAFKGNAWKCRAGEVRADDRTGGRTHVVPLVEVASRQQRDAESVEQPPADHAILQCEAAAIEGDARQRSAAQCGWTRGDSFRWREERRCRRLPLLRGLTQNGPPALLEMPLAARCCSEPLAN